MIASTADERQQRRLAASEVAESQAGVLHRRQLSELGWSYAQVEAEISAGRWRRSGEMTVITYTGPATRTSIRWRAVLEVGPTAVLAGVSALQAAGMSGIDAASVHVAVPKSSRPRRPRGGVVVHETRRLRRQDVAATGLPRMRVAPAAVLAALWAASDRQAALMLVAPVQQRLVMAADLLAPANRVRRHRRRALIQAVMSDLLHGAETLGEIDFATLCREAGLPEPTRQRLVQRRSGRWYLDVEWEEWGVVVEIDGVHHMSVSAWVDDAWRQNEVVIAGRVVLRFPQLVMRTDPVRVVAQVREALLRRGWTPGAVALRPSHPHLLVRTARTVVGS